MKYTNGILKIGHLINPVKLGPERDLSWQQPITFESMKHAKDFAKDEIEIEQVACFYPEDESMVPDDFIKTRPLERSTEGKFEIDRKLPYFKDMLDRLYDVSDADYFIQTNADIGLMPQFYMLVKDMIENNVESFCINKRIIPEEIIKSGLQAIWSSVGKEHAGCDCFVFPRKLYPKFDIGEICMGTPWSETTLITNMIRYAKVFTIFKNAHATFHLGDRRIWLGHEYNDYRIHNTNEFARILKRFKKNKMHWQKISSNPAMINQLAKLKMEVHNYSQSGEVYSQDCWDLIS